METSNIHLEAKLKRANKDLELQRKMTKHYARRNQVTREKLKKALIEIHALKRGKDQEKIGVLEKYSL